MLDIYNLNRNTHYPTLQYLYIGVNVYVCVWNSYLAFWNNQIHLEFLYMYTVLKRRKVINTLICTS